MRCLSFTAQASALVPSLPAWRAWLWLLVWLVLPAQAQTLQVCISDEDFPPFTSPTEELAGQQRIRQAGARQGWQVTFIAMPWRRCLAGVEHGIYSAVAGVAAIPEHQAMMAFPQRGEQADPTRGLGATRLLVYRPRGSLADWDGRVFSHMAKPLLYLSGRTTLKSRFDQLGVASVDIARSSRQLAMMLLKGRGSLVVDHDFQVARVLALPEFRGQLEVLPVPFGEAPVYLAVGWPLYQGHRREVEALWDAMAAAIPAASAH